MTVRELYTEAEKLDALDRRILFMGVEPNIFWLPRGNKNFCLGYHSDEPEGQEEDCSISDNSDAV